ncbi:MAG TPA: nickel-dependent hydrogenase large subunit [Candidatus Eisenbacteria bacterium]|nr:nickel-dependent hydrogenase large subunit [Candidatus Eisenbacteria bacterium]
MGDRSIRVSDITRVEGEGALHVRARGGRVEAVWLDIFEPPRYFEALLRGRTYLEPVDITARICGICPVAYQLTAAQAIEAACGVVVDGPLRDLRRLLYLGEWIQSHALHVYLLHAPDFLGYDGVVDMARDHPDVVRRGLRLKKAGNRLMEVIGGRAVHPVSPRVGGFHRTPDRRELAALVAPLEEAREDALATVRWAAGLDFPELEVAAELVALRASGEYAVDRGRVCSGGGLDLAPAEFGERLAEAQVPHSTALVSTLGGRAYLVGPLARYSLSSERLLPEVRASAREAGLGPVCRNPFRSIVVRSVEMLQACQEALAIVRRHRPPDRPFLEVAPRAGEGSACTEAPRGLLYHRYRLDEAGRIVAATIVPPTSQNQLAIEADLRRLVEEGLDLPDGELAHLCERGVRNHDPCISCAAHFLRLDVDRG